MSVPVFLVGAALLFWGQQSGHWAWAISAALGLESTRLFERRWELSRQHFHRLADLCTLLFGVSAVYLYFSGEGGTALYQIIVWFPISLLPLVAAQVLSVQGRLDIGALFWSQRVDTPGVPARSVDFAYPYIVVCLLCASAANNRTPMFYGGMFLLSGWALWAVRPRSASVWAWAAILGGSGVLGYGAQLRLHRLQASLEQAAVELVFGRADVRMDPTQSRTAIGQIGRIKQSSEIIWRLSLERGGIAPSLVRGAAYDLYKDGQWLVREPAFRDLARVEDGWLLSPVPAAGHPLSFTGVWSETTGILPVPHGTVRLGGPEDMNLSLSRQGTVKAVVASPLVRFSARAGDGAHEPPPGVGDLQVPDGERAHFAALAAALKLDSRVPQKAMAVAARHFADKFEYSVYLEGGGKNALGDFLNKTRSGHCEFFATATVLLMRAAGIPARYATGYSVQEYSRLEGAYLLRQRHAHAWTLVWVDGAWLEFDTTPASWSAVEEGRAKRFEWLSDLAGWARLRLTRLRWGSARGPGRWVLWLLLPLALWVLWRAGAAFRAPARLARGRGEVAMPGTDSELYGIERALEAEGLGRRASETHSAWLSRVSPGLGPDRAGRLRPLVVLHNRLRFDPAGLSSEERRGLQAAARAWR